MDSLRSSSPMPDRTFEDTPATRERWRAIRGFTGYYEVSNRGRVRSVDRRVRRAQGGKQWARSRLLSQCVLKRGGYLAVSLWKQGRGRTVAVHRLVALTFMSPRPPDCEINHRDGDKTNNATSNLEWVTRSENVRHAVATGLLPRMGEANPAARLSVETVRAIKAARARGERVCDIAAAHGVQPSHVSAITTGRIWGHV